MSSIKLAPNASGTGEFTIAAPNSNTNRTFNLPDSSGTIATAESTLSQFNASGSAPVYACRAWVNFNGTGTVAIRASGNVTSITDNNVGDYTVNFTSAMSDVNYCFNITAESRGASSRFVFGYIDTASTTTSLRFGVAGNTNGTAWGLAGTDTDEICVAIFR